MLDINFNVEFDLNTDIYGTRKLLLELNDLGYCDEKYSYYVYRFDESINGYLNCDSIAKKIMNIDFEQNDITYFVLLFVALFFEFFMIIIIF